jgi:hypothetical protein
MLRVTSLRIIAKPRRQNPAAGQESGADPRPRENFAVDGFHDPPRKKRLEERAASAAAAALADENQVSAAEVLLPETLVYQNLRDAGCARCAAAIPQGAMSTLDEGKARRLDCAGLHGWEFRPRGDAALTRRATALAPRKVVARRLRARYRRPQIESDSIQFARSGVSGAS